MTTDHAQDHTVSLLLEQASHGDPAAAEALVTRIYGELRELSARLLREERAGHTLQPTALVHEAVLKLLGPRQLAALSNKQMLFAAAARAMRQVLVDYARRRKSQKRGQGWQRTPADEALEALGEEQLDFETLNLAMDELAEFSQRAAKAVDLRFFAGLSIKEVANALGVSIPTIEKDLAKAHRFLRERMR